MFPDSKAYSLPQHSVALLSPTSHSCSALIQLWYLKQITEVLESQFAHLLKITKTTQTTMNVQPLLFFHGLWMVFAGSWLIIGNGAFHSPEAWQPWTLRGSCTTQNLMLTV